jgi:Raf kinase inhibitor-like YbhB/YbcL family protein
LQLSSKAFEEGGDIPQRYSCKGQNINPPLDIAGVPNEAVSLALIVHDPDAVNTDFVHWIAWDVPASTTMIGEGSLPPSAQNGSNGAGKNGYTGPCPPAGTGAHHYNFEIYALNKQLGLPADTTREQLEQAMKGHILAQSTLIGLFKAD